MGDSPHAPLRGPGFPASIPPCSRGSQTSLQSVSRPSLVSLLIPPKKCSQALLSSPLPWPTKVWTSRTPEISSPEPRTTLGNKSPITRAQPESVPPPPSAHLSTNPTLLAKQLAAYPERSRHRQRESRFPSSPSAQGLREPMKAPHPLTL